RSRGYVNRRFRTGSKIRCFTTTIQRRSQVMETVVWETTRQAARQQGYGRDDTGNRITIDTEAAMVRTSQHQANAQKN
ncbi:MAG: hypothetical protein KFH87_08790, partial [Bacteroidetes bacterium]|nr:hypothetical protein [Bacteroidota bacterium]